MPVVTNGEPYWLNRHAHAATGWPMASTPGISSTAIIAA
nr:MAG TPA: hypothetical protein [Caudoviricetes sp.]